MSNTLPDYQRRALESRRAHLIEEYEAIMTQLSHTLNAADELKLKRQAQAHEAEIAEIEAQLDPAKIEVQSDARESPLQSSRSDTKPSSSSAPDVAGKADKDQEALGNKPSLTDMVSPSKTLTWLHLSDLHFRESHNYDETIVLKALLRDITGRIEKDGLQPDFIAITGDVAFSGKLEEYKLARSFFDDLLKIAKLPRERLFIIPGNHDVDRKLITRGAQAMTDALSDRDSSNAVLAETTDLGAIMRRFKGYAEFVNDYFGGHSTFDNKQYFYVRSLLWPGPRVMIMGLNSAWVCASDNDKTPGVLLGERQTRAALELAESGDLKIALLHHPFDWLREFDQNNSAAMLLDDCNFILYGHLHRTAATQLSGPDTSAMVIGGGACYETREYPNMYNFVRLELGARTGTVYLRRYSDERGGFWVTDTLTYKNAPEGKYAFRF